MGSRVAGAGRVIPHQPDDPAAQVIRDLFTGAVAEAFMEENTERARGPVLSLSGLGGCSKAAAYAISRTPPSDEPPPEEARAATLGTWEHAGLLPRLADGFGGQHEVPVKLRAAGIVIKGTTDLIAPLPRTIARLAGGVAVVDAKTVGEHRLHGVRRAGAYEDHRVQVWGYALACFQEGMPVEWVVWVYMDRATGDVQTVVERFDVRTALAVVNHARRLRQYAELDPDSAPREGLGPGLSFACDRCWWLKRCWGEDAEPGRRGAQANLILSDADVEAAALLHYDANELEKLAKQRKEFAKAVLERHRGTYGPWKVGYSNGQERLNQAEARRLLEENGLPVPLMRTAGSVSVRPVSKVAAPALAELPLVSLLSRQLLRPTVEAAPAVEGEVVPGLPAGETGAPALPAGGAV